MGEGESLLLDFGNHFVGRVTLRLGYVGNHPDAPVWLRLKRCESPRELGETLENYRGWISKGWIQEEQVHVDVLPREKAYACLCAVAKVEGALGMVSPYMMHHYMDALYRLGHPDEARQAMLDYWGGMVKLGADTFFELYNPADPDESPYGSPIVNSYCHAWSCTPAYFLRTLEQR